MKIFRHRTLFSMLLTVLFLSVSTGVSAADFNHIVAFGDSLSDHGGLSAYNATFIANSGQPAPESWTNNGAFPYGGDVWLDYLKDELDATLENYAIGGAMTIGHERESIQALINAELIPNLGLTGQITTYLESSPTYNADKTLFTIWIGGNDCLEFFRREYYTSDAETLITDSVGRIIIQMGSLYADGARNFLVLNLPDLSITPAFNTSDATTRAQVSGVVTGFNSALATALAGFESAHADVQVESFDAFTYLNDVIQNDVFDNTTSTYLNVDENCDWDFVSFNGSYDEFLFFDCIHPTTRAHELVAAEVADNINVDDVDDINDDDDDDNCFIATSSADSNRQPVAMISGIFLVIGFAGLMLKKK